MKFSQASLLAACLPAISARFIETVEADNVILKPDELYLIETAPGKTQWVTEEQKWELRRVRIPSYDTIFARRQVR
jgi:leucyl aminopeptidase